MDKIYNNLMLISTQYNECVDNVLFTITLCVIYILFINENIAKKKIFENTHKVKHIGVDTYYRYA